MNSDKLNSLIFSISHEIELIDSNILKDFPISYYLDLLKSERKNALYRDVNPEARMVIDKLTLLRGDIMASLYNRLAVVNLVKEAESNLNNLSFPKNMQKMYCSYFNKLIEKISSVSHNINANYYQLNNEKFLKDIGICKFSLLLAGPVLLDSGYFPIKYLLNNGPVPFIKGLYCIIRYNALSPVLKMHTHITSPVVMSKFNEEGWKGFYLNTALLMLGGNRSKGIYCAGWFFDPVLKKISPELAYINQFVREIGGVIFRLGSDEKIIKDATFLNRKRKQLFAEGKYVPFRYVIFVPRKKLLKWYQQQQLS